MVHEENRATKFRPQAVRPCYQLANILRAVLFAADEATTFACSLDGAAFAACSSPTVLTGIGAGDHDFTIRATDAAGNTAVTTRHWTVTPPVVTFSVKPDDLSDDTVWGATARMLYELLELVALT